MPRRRTKAFDVCVFMAFVVARSLATGELDELDVMLRFTVEPESAIAARHSVVFLNCSAEGQNGSDVEVTWRRNGDAVIPDGRRLMQTAEGYLVIRSFGQQRSDEGFYECVARSGTSVLVSRMARVQLPVLGHFSGHPLSVTVSPGRNARFTCVISGVPKPNVTWRRNDQPLKPSDRCEVLVSGVLQLANVTASDAGDYSCHAEGLVHQKTSNSATLTIATPHAVSSGNTAVQLIGRPRDTGAEVGSTATFECFPSHGNFSIVWTRKDGVPLPSARARVSRLGNLELRDLEESDAGTYNCRARGGGQTLQGEATLTVTVPPRLLSSNRDGGQARAQTIEMSCTFGGMPTPAITWLKNGQPMRSYGRIKVLGERLVIGQSTDSDTALYQCWAENEVGREGAVIPLVIRSSGFAPSPPTALQTRALDSRRIELAWNDSPSTSDDYPIVGYSVHHWPLLGGQESQEVSRDARIIVTKLLPYTNYTFYVRAYNRGGASEHSSYVVQATDEDVPLVAPEVHVVPSSATSLRVTWEALTPNEARGVIIRFKVFYRKQEEEVHEITVAGDVFEHELTGLETEEKYSVRVSASTKAGFPKLEDDRWPWVSQVVSKSAHVGVRGLPNIRIRVLNATTVQMTWDTPQSFGTDLLGFKIFYNVIGEAQKTIILVEDDTEHVLLGLRPDSVYEISIGAFTDYGDGELYKQVVRTPPLGKLPSNTPHSAPVILEAKALNETAIELTWTMPLDNVNFVLYYTISCTPLTVPGSSARPQEMLINSTVTRLVISGLRPYTEHQIAVRAQTTEGPGTFSSKVICQTDEGRPPGLLEITWFLQEPTVVQLNWKMPPNTNGIVSQYVVSFCEEKFAAQHPWQTHVENGSFCYTVIRGLKSRTTYQVQMHAENRKGAGPASSIKVFTGMLQDTEGGNTSDRLMGIVIGIGISGGCIIICVFIILLRNRCLPPPRGGSVMMHHANGFTTPLHSNGCVAGHTDDKHAGHEPDGTTPMLTQTPDLENMHGKLEMTSAKHVKLWSLADKGRTSPMGKSTTVV